MRNFYWTILAYSPESVNPLAQMLWNVNRLRWGLDKGPETLYNQLCLVATGY